VKILFLTSKISEKIIFDVKNHQKQFFDVKNSRKCFFDDFLIVQKIFLNENSTFSNFGHRLNLCPNAKDKIAIKLS